VDADGRTRLQVGKGQITHHIRNVWRLNTILNDGGQKSRDDHRHHAVDAVAIALTEPKIIKNLSDIAKRARKAGKSYFGRESISAWPGFLDDVRTSIQELTVSHRVSHRVNTAFHKQTIYSREKEYDGKNCVHIRRTLEGNLRKSDLPNIVDDRIRHEVFEKIRALGHDPEKLDDAKLQKLFGTPENLPSLNSKDGRIIPVKKVRVRKAETVMTVGGKGRERNVSPGSNSHIEIFKNPSGKWIGRLINSFEALQRQQNGRPVVERISEWEFVCSLSGGDIIELEMHPNCRELYVIKILTFVTSGKNTYPNIFFAPLNQAKPAKLLSSLIGPLGAKYSCRKVSINPLGDIHYAND
jgi:CRISPR-associated endonuclease Csn1